MVSNAERKRRRRAGTTKGGRPAVAGERYPCGKLRPQKNERLIDAKRALVGDGLDIALADDPLEFIHAKGWLSTPRYRAAIAYRDARRRANVGAPGLGAGGVAETASTTGLGGLSFNDMTAEEVTAVFDHVFRDPPAISAEEREAKALQRWKRLEAAMTPDQRREVGLIVVQASWTFWITALNIGKEPVGRYQQARRDFEAGLDAMREAMRPPAVVERALATYEALPRQAAPPARKLVEALNYVDEAGEPVQMASAKGRPFKVAQKVRAP